MDHKTMADLLLEEHERNIRWRVRRNLFLLACAGIAAGSLFYIAVFK